MKPKIGRDGTVIRPPRRVSRRGVLQGLALGGAATFLQPVAKGILRHASGQPPSQKRVLFVVLNNGDGEGRRPAARESGGIDFKVWSPLARHESDITVVRNLYNPYGLGLHGSSWFLTAADPVGDAESRRPGGPSIDRVLGAQLQGMAPIRSINMGVWNSAASGSHSADGEGVVFPKGTLLENYSRIFDLSGASAEETAARLQSSGRLMDFVRADVAQVEREMVGRERERLQFYVQSINDLEDQMRALAANGARCGAPPLNAADYEGPERNHLRADTATQFVTLALGCGYANVATMDWQSVHRGDGGLAFLEDDTTGRHSMWHGDGTQERYAAWFGFHAEKIANMWDQLKAIPEGDGTAADNTLIVCLNRAGGRHHNGAWDGWALLIGNPGGALPTGQVIELPNARMETDDLRLRAVSGETDRAPRIGSDAPVHSMNDFYIAIADAVGVSLDTFGDPRSMNSRITLG